MRVFLDENLPVELAGLLPGHEVLTGEQMGWLGVKNGALLKLVEQEFDAMLTMDKGILHQHDHRDRKLKIGVFRATNSRISSLEPMIPTAEEFIRNGAAGALAFVTSEGCIYL